MNDTLTVILLTLGMLQFPVMIFAVFNRKRFDKLERDLLSTQERLIPILERQILHTEVLTEILKSRNTTQSKSSASRIE